MFAIYNDPLIATQDARGAEVNKLDHKTGKVGQFWQISIFKKETLNSLSLRKTIGMS